MAIVECLLMQVTQDNQTPTAEIEGILKHTNKFKSHSKLYTPRQIRGYLGYVAINKPTPTKWMGE